MIKLSKKELRILHELAIDARQSLSSIAKKCRLSKETVNYHIKKLERGGVIKEYFLLKDTSRLGLLTYRIYIKQKMLDPKMEYEMIEFTKNEPDLLLFGRTSGEMDYVLILSKQNEYEFGKFIEELLRRFGKDINWIKTQILLDYAEHTREYLTGEPKKTFCTISGKERAKFDDTDLKIISELDEDAKVPFSEVAKRLDLSERVVRYRVSRMEKEGIIITYRCNINYRILGYHSYKVDLFLKDRSDIKDIRNFIDSLPNSVYSQRSVYYSDVEFDVEVKDLDELLKTIHRINDKFPSSIKEFKYYSMLEIYK